MALFEHDARALAPEWDALAERAGASPFLRPGWILPWHDAFGVGKLRLVGLKRDGELVAAIPLMRRGARMHGPANTHTPVFGPIAASEGDRDELLAALYREKPPTIDLTQVDDATLEAARAAAVAAGRVICGRSLQSPPHVTLDGAWEEYLRGFSRNRRKEWRRVWRRLQEQGDVTVEITGGTEDLDRRLEEVYSVEGSGWKTARGTAIAASPQTHRFYTEVSRWAAERDWLRLAVLRVDGKPIAVDLAFVHGGVWYALKGGYDAEWARYAAGITLLQHTLQHAFETGLHRFELLGAADPYKLVWANGESRRSWFAAFDPSPRGRTAYVVTATRERARPLARRMRSRVNRPSQAAAVAH
jgi:CelD/BcsL family acetyltransferase involved in cellulose biosynthesis